VLLALEPFSRDHLVQNKEKRKKKKQRKQRRFGRVNGVGGQFCSLWGAFVAIFAGTHRKKDTIDWVNGCT
jgi:hypothetical protein